MALRGIYAVKFLNVDKNRVEVRTCRRGRLIVNREPRFEQVV